MRKDHLHRRSREVDATNDTEENGDPLSGSADPFDALVNSKSDETASSRTNGKKAPSPVQDDSDAENDTEAKNDANSETNGESAESAENGDANGDPDDTGDGEDEGYEVESIVGHKFKGKKKLFRIRWKNYGESDDTWEAEDDLSCPEIIEQYLADHPDAKESKTKPKKEKKVRISLPSEAPTRATPKRTAAERKAILDDPLSDGDESTPKKKSPPGKRGRPKTKKAAGKPAKKEEYEVLKIIDDEVRSGKKYYRIRWKGWSAKDDTWEPKSSLSCPDIIKAYESSKEDDKEYEVEKIVGEKVEFGKRSFLVKWKGWTENDNSWETDVDCIDLIEKFRDSCRSANKSNKRSSSAAPSSAKAKKARKTVDDDDDDDDNNDDESADEKEWEVEKIVNVRSARGGKKEYLIRWKGCKASDDTWEPENGISCPSLITAFLKKNKK